VRLRVKNLELEAAFTPAGVKAASSSRFFTRSRTPGPAEVSDLLCKQWLPM